jgi:phage terminase Nu1 subunit (DNA packaging protein)
VSYSTAKIAKVLDLSPERIRQLERQGVLKKVNQRYELVDSVHAYIHFLRERVGVNKPASAESEAHHKLRLTKARADMAELEFSVR